MIFNVFANNKRFYRFAFLIGYDGKRIGYRISPQSESSRRGNITIFEHVKNNRTDKIHAFGVKRSWFAIEVIVAFSSGCESKRWIFAVFERSRENYFAQSFLHFVNGHSFFPPQDQLWFMIKNYYVE